MQIGIIILGRMGGNMARRLAPGAARIPAPARDRGWPHSGSAGNGHLVKTICNDFGGHAVTKTS